MIHTLSLTRFQRLSERRTASILLVEGIRPREQLQHNWKRTTTRQLVATVNETFDEEDSVLTLKYSSHLAIQILTVEGI
jgi:hypothetical protein